MGNHLNPNKLEFVTEMGQIINPRIQPLFLIKVERQKIVTLDKLRYEFLKLFCPPSKTDFESDDELTTEPANYFVAQQLINKFECQKKVWIKGIFKYFYYIIVLNKLYILFNNVTLDDL